MADERLGVEHQMVVGEQVGLKHALVPCALRLIIPVLIEEGGALALMRLLSAHDIIDRSVDHNSPLLGNNSGLEQVRQGLLVRQQLLVAACNIVHQYIQGSVLGVVVEGVGLGGGEDGGGGAILGVLGVGGVPGVAVEAGGAVFGVGDQVVVVVLIEFDRIIPAHRVEQADGVGLLVLLDGIGLAAVSVYMGGGCDSAQGDQAGRDLPGEGLGVPFCCDGQLQISQVGLSVDLVALHGAGKSVSSAVVVCCGRECVVSIEHGGGVHHLHVGAQLIGKGDEAALPAGALCALGGLCGRGGRLSGNVVCDLIKDLFPCLCIVDICYLVVRVVVGEAGDGGREVREGSGRIANSPVIPHDFNAAVCLIVVEIIIKIIGVRIGG